MLCAYLTLSEISLCSVFCRAEVSDVDLTVCFRYMSRVKDLTVLPDSLFLGPHETHLQFFVWKQMLGSIKPGEELEKYLVMFSDISLNKLSQFMY